MELVHRNGGLALEFDVRLARKGDKSAFERLIQENKISLYRVAKGILKSEDDIGDAIQETILKAYKGLPKLRQDHFFKTWLIKIIINECNTILRHQKRLIPMESVPHEDSTNITEHDQMELMCAIDSLDQDLKVVTILYYYEDMSIKAIASTVNIPEGTVKSRLSRAREKLYYTLAGKEGLDYGREANG